jgi:hypothetical protein
MKTIQSITIALLLATSPALMGAQSLDLSWFTLDGGGGTSTGVTYAVSGTIGQPDAGMLSAGNYTLQGGFWPGVQPSSQCPFTGINIERLGQGRVRISWPLAQCGYVLYHTPTLTGWALLPPPYTTNQTSLSVIRSERAEFLQLRRSP